MIREEPTSLQVSAISSDARHCALEQSTRRQSMKRIAAVGAALAIPGLTSQPQVARAAGAEFTYKLGIALAPSHPTTAGLMEACSEILKESKGRLFIDVFPSSALGGDTSMISQVRSGAIDFVSTAGVVWGTVVPMASLSGIGFAFPGYEQVWSAMDGGLGEHIREAFAKASLFAQAKVWDHGFRQITSSVRPITTPADLAGFKIRVPPSPALTSLFKAYGAAPTSINMAELYTALESKVVDGQENPLSVLETQRLHEVQKFCSLTSHVWDGFWLVANARSWNALPEALRRIAAESFDAHAVRQRHAVAALNDHLRGELRAKGMAFNEPDQALFREVLRKTPFYRESKARFSADAWVRLEKYAGPLG